MWWVYAVQMESLAHHMAQQARRFGLELAHLEDARPEAVQAFAQTILSDTDSD